MAVKAESPDICCLTRRISFSYEKGAVSVEIDTARLNIRSYNDKDFENSVALYGNPLATKYFDNGKPRSKEQVAELVGDIGHKYFSNGQPFGLFTIFSKAEFVGHIDLVPTEESGEVEVGFILDPKFQGQGFGTESAQALVYDYIDELNSDGITSNGSSIQRIMATVHPENIPSQKVLEKIGLSFEKFQERFERPRYWYGLSRTATSIGSLNRCKNGFI